MINYICISDMHFGAETSLMTFVHPHSYQTDPTKPSAVLIEWIKCMRYILSKTNPEGKKPKLILNGDILELALSNTNEAAMAFEQFINLAFPPDKSQWIFDAELHLLPGNHDHHLWEKARETQYVEYIKKIKPGKYLPIPWHTTKLFEPDPVPDYFLNNLIQRHEHLEGVCVSTIYPSYLITNDDKSKGVIFSHGHYVEDLYMLMSTLKTMIFPDRQRPQDMWDLEAENFAWIDFFWSTMGRSGEVGKDIEIIYNKMQSPEALRELTDNLAESIAQKWEKNFIKEEIVEHALKWILGEVLGRAAESERGVKHKELDDDTLEGLAFFMQQPLLNQIRTEMGGQVPPKLSFIFGHTHKPFEKMIVFRGYPQAVKVYNEGGWVVDTMNPQPLHGGSVVLVDENLDAVSLKMYHEKDYEVSIAECKYPDEEHTDFYQQMEGLINNEQEPFASFNKTIEKEIKIRWENLRRSVEA